MEKFKNLEGNLQRQAAELCPVWHFFLWLDENIEDTLIKFEGDRKLEKGMNKTDDKIKIQNSLDRLEW